MPEFEWDEAKAVANLRKHGVSFEFAAVAFDDPFAVERLDHRYDYGEERIILLGMTDGRILSVAFTERGENRVRIFSARRASKHEQDYYYRKNAP